MIPFTAGIAVVKELAGVLVEVVEDGDTYRKLDAVRAFLSEATGIEIDKAGFLALLEETTQGAPYTGKWEMIGEGPERRLRVDGAYIYDFGRGNCIPISDQ